ncbi:MAG: hypothetical protein JXQ87_00915 [Bacteroidia bacterium]
MKGFIIWLGIIMISLPILVSAQEGQDSKIAIELNYYGDFIMHPGIETGIQYNILQKEKLTLHADLNLGAYWHKWNHNAYFTQAKLGTRITGKSGFFTDFSLGLGFMLTTPNGDIYSGNESFEIVPIRRPINRHLAPNGSLMFGWDFSKKSESKWMCQLGLEAFWQYQVNQYSLPHLALKTGIIYNL